MVEKKLAPAIKLSPEMKKELEKAGEDIGRAEKAISNIEKLGLDASELKDKLAWAKNVRITLLKDFT